MKRFKFILACVVIPVMAITVRSNAQSNYPNGSAIPGVTAVTPSGALSSGFKVNYVRTRQSVAPVSDAAVFDTANYIRVKQVTEYIDGLGRPLQTVIQQVSPGFKDMVSPVMYDPMGREALKYLPYTSTQTNGSFKLDAFGEQATFMASQYSGESVYYSKTIFEPSPLNRVEKMMAPGNSWADPAHAVKMQYLVNESNDSVQVWAITNDTLLYTTDDAARNIPTSSGFYAAGTLFETHAFDENGKETVEYKDKSGKVILKKVQAADITSNGHYGWLCTYYVYDDFGLLRFVMPPKAVQYLAANSWTVSGTIAGELCFRYEYDNRDRMTAKKVPGSGWTYMVYDKRDRLAFTQDANLRSKNQWLTNLYDDQNRPVSTGMIGYSGNRGALQWLIDTLYNAASSTTVAVNFYAPDTLYVNERETGRSIYRAKETVIFTGDMETEPTAEMETILGAAIISTTNILQNYNPVPPGSTLIALTLNYYDDYSWTSKTYSTTDNSKVDDGGNLYAESLPASASLLTQGMLTGTKVRVIGNPDELSNGNWISTATFYDNKGRVIQSASENFTNGNDVNTLRYDFSGKAITTYNVHNNAAAGQTVRVKTNMFYDHAGRLLGVKKTLNDNSDNARYLSRNEYDELGQLLNKKLGQKNVSDATEMEAQAYEYNIRGWLRGINKGYTAGTGTKWFGMELNYDYGYASNQYNGNIAGSQWRSRGDGERRSFGYGYDAANRLLYADFNQYTGGWNKNAGIDYTTLMGDGINYNSAYDANGNITRMQQKAWKISGSALIDDLSYTYTANSNKLLNVIDAKNDPDTRLGDFRTSSTWTAALGTKTNTATDYTYDDNGNLLYDKNKDITAIVYNHLNLPYQVTVSGKGTITYVYDATGNKLEKRTVEASPSITTKTTYLGGYVYKNDMLQFLAHEEGRIRKKTDNSFVYDYFVKDHLGNTRMVLTEERDQNSYPVVTLEDNATGVEGSYYNIETGKIVSNTAVTGFASAFGSGYKNNNGNPPYNTNPTSIVTNTSEKLYKINGSTGSKTGLGITIHVMSGDTVNIFGRSFWHSNGTAPTNSYNAAAIDLLNVLANAGGIVATAKGVTPSDLSGLTPVTNAVDNFLTDGTRIPGSSPKAYINWVLFDEQFKVEATSSGFRKMSSTSDVIDSMTQEVNIGRNGYLYVYCSNESNADVYFDNFQVVHSKGPLLEETHYYPFGLTMAGISSKAAGKLENRYKYNGNKLESGEFSDGSGLEMYDFNARTYDQQIGRFMQIDPLADEEEQESFTPYHFGFNNPILNNDPDGKQPIVPIIRALYYLSRYAQETGVAPAANVPRVLMDATRVNTQSVLPLGIKKELDRAKSEATQEQAATEKKVPNPNGKKGGEAHQKGVDDAEKNLKKEGYDNTQREVKVETPDGEKSSRYIDVRGTKTKTGETKDVQVGKENKNGTPVARERRAMDDIKKETGKKPEFHPYNKPNN